MARYNIDDLMALARAMDVAGGKVRKAYKQATEPKNMLAMLELLALGSDIMAKWGSHFGYNLYSNKPREHEADLDNMSSAMLDWVQRFEAVMGEGKD